MASSIGLVECGSENSFSPTNHSAKPGPVAPPVVGVVLRPAILVRRRLLERPVAVIGRRVLRSVADVDRVTEQDEAHHALGMVDREDAGRSRHPSTGRRPRRDRSRSHRAPRSHRRRTPCRRTRPGREADPSGRCRVRRTSRRGSAGRGRGSAASSGGSRGPTTVGISRIVGRTIAVAFPEDADAVAFDEPGLVRVPGAGSAPARRRTDRRPVPTPAPSPGRSCSAGRLARVESVEHDADLAQRRPRRAGRLRRSRAGCVASAPRNGMPMSAATSPGVNGPRFPSRSSSRRATSVSNRNQPPSIALHGARDVGIRPTGGDHLLEDPHVAGLEVRLEEVAGALPTLPERLRPGVHRRLPFQEPRVLARQDGQDELLLRTEVVVDLAQRHVRQLGDATSREPRVAVLEQRPPGGEDDRRPGGRWVAAFRRRGLGPGVREGGAAHDRRIPVRPSRT